MNPYNYLLCAAGSKGLANALGKRRFARHVFLVYAGYLHLACLRRSHRVVAGNSGQLRHPGTGRYGIGHEAEIWVTTKFQHQKVGIRILQLQSIFASDAYPVGSYDIHTPFFLIRGLAES